MSNFWTTEQSTTSTHRDIEGGFIGVLEEISPLSTSSEVHHSDSKGKSVPQVHVTSFSAPGYQPASLLPSEERVDYLAGLLVFSCLLGTAIQFNLTFAAASINPSVFVHYSSEVWARKTITAYFLNLNWIGPFLLTSTQFLVSTFIHTGNLGTLAEKIVKRPFRLLIPIFCIAMIEYFFIDSGATTWLQYLPSVTWSTWPFVTIPNTFGHFISEVLQLVYLIPNAAPQLTYNYCTGVLWSISVQLQGTWVTYIGVIVIREIKTLWKRLGYYSFCILMHWYALSWGTYFYLGILLADLDVTYNWKDWLYSHTSAYYTFITLCGLLSFGGLSVDMATQWTGVNYIAYEYGIHPDPATGLPIAQTSNAGYPQYFVPKLNGLVFAVALQVFVNVSPRFQKIFSFRVLTYLFRHTFTIYLIHGFVFWSMGSLLCVYLASHGFAYWLNISIVGVTCYVTLGLSLVLLTPVVGTLGKDVTANIWQYAWEQPAPRRPTTYPFEGNILSGGDLIVNFAARNAPGDAEKC